MYLRFFRHTRKSSEQINQANWGLTIHVRIKPETRSLIHHRFFSTNRRLTLTNPTPNNPPQSNRHHKTKSKPDPANPTQHTLDRKTPKRQTQNNTREQKKKAREVFFLHFLDRPSDRIFNRLFIEREPTLTIVIRRGLDLAFFTLRIRFVTLPARMWFFVWDYLFVFDYFSRFSCRVCVCSGGEMARLKDTSASIARLHVAWMMEGLFCSVSGF